MAYRVDYPQCGKARKQQKASSKVIPFTILFFLLFLLCAAQFWQQGVDALRELLLPGDAAVTVSALQDFTQALKTGAPLSSAFTEFCQQVLQGAGVYLG